MCRVGSVAQSECQGFEGKLEALHANTICISPPLKCRWDAFDLSIEDIKAKQFPAQNRLLSLAQLTRMQNFKKKSLNKYSGGHKKGARRKQMISPEKPFEENKYEEAVASPSPSTASFISI